MLRVIVFSMILVFAGADSALAQDDDYARNGIYLGFNMAGAWYTDVKGDLEKEMGSLPPTVPPLPAFGVKVEDPLGVGGRVGYRFHPNLAGEVEFQWFSDANIQFFDDKSTVNVLDIETLRVTGNVKGYLLTGRIQPFLLVGAGVMRVNVKEKRGLGLRGKEEDFAARFGAGIDFYLTPNILAVVEGGYVLATGKLDGLDHVLWSVGLQYRF